MDIAELQMELPNGTKIWVYIPGLDIGYGLTVQRFELRI